MSVFSSAKLITQRVFESIQISPSRKGINRYNPSVWKVSKVCLNLV